MDGEVHPLRSFELRAWARAVLLREGVFADFDDAFAALWADAERDGLVAQHGWQALMQIIEHAYHNVVPEAEASPA